MPNSKDQILKKIREALIEPVALPFPKSEGNSPAVVPLAQDIEIEFAEKLTALQGKSAFCQNKKELSRQVNELISNSHWDKIFCLEPKIGSLIGETVPLATNQDALADCDVAITGCEYLVARTGSVVMSSAQLSGRNTSVYAPVHICIAFSNQLVYDIRDALEGIKEKYGASIPSLITFATGPSRTADIEKTLVVGVHGPKEVYVFLVDEEQDTEIKK